MAAVLRVPALSSTVEVVAVVGAKMLIAMVALPPVLCASFACPYPTLRPALLLLTKAVPPSREEVVAVVVACPFPTLSPLLLSKAVPLSSEDVLPVVAVVDAPVSFLLAVVALVYEPVTLFLAMISEQQTPEEAPY